MENVKDDGNSILINREDQIENFFYLILKLIEDFVQKQDYIISVKNELEAVYQKLLHFE